MLRQFVVGNAQVIVAYEVVSDGDDYHQFRPMVEEAAKNLSVLDISQCRLFLPMPATAVKRTLNIWNPWRTWGVWFLPAGSARCAGLRLNPHLPGATPNDNGPWT